MSSLLVLILLSTLISYCCKYNNIHRVVLSCTITVLPQILQASSSVQCYQHKVTLTFMIFTVIVTAKGGHNVAYHFGVLNDMYIYDSLIHYFTIISPDAHI